MFVTEAGAEDCRFRDPNKYLRQTREKPGEFGDAKRKMLCVQGLLVETRTGRSTPPGSQAEMRNEALHEEENVTLVMKWQRTWPEPCPDSRGTQNLRAA